ncbi:uncharacterized protein LOC134253824 [Saccostrea cucullata]|uniref:uncharacterized protein LOC134253824 n=1 Tax=Saccostrea cuccullata TaxID=36930 RepID=UPI002ED2BB5E
MAVDGNLATCARLDVIGSSSRYDRAWWYMDLGDIHCIYSIRIQFEDMGETYVQRQRGRFAGFSLYLSNSTKKEEGYMCYKDGPDLPPLNFTTKCIGYGRYVIYYNERLSGVTYPAGYEAMSYSQLCEVVVEACDNGYYGFNCSSTCSGHCLYDKPCNKETGHWTRDVVMDILGIYVRMNVHLGGLERTVEYFVVDTVLIRLFVITRTEFVHMDVKTVIPGKIVPHVIFRNA